MTAPKIKLVVPAPDFSLEPGENVQMLVIDPAGTDPDREVPGFFIIQLDGTPIWPGDGTPPSGQPIPRTFLSLAAVHDYLRETYGWETPLRVTHEAQIEPGGLRDFPTIWGADRRIGRKKVQVRVRYLGSFRYWNGRRVDPTKVGTALEFN